MTTVPAPAFLYRGVSASMHRRDAGRLIPKASGPIETTFSRDGSVSRTRGADPRDAGATRYPSVTNGVLQHQLHQAGYPDCGISTTPHFEKAREYALHAESTGVIYVIDTALLETARVTALSVRDFVPTPSAPADDEVLLVADRGGSLPPDIIVDVVSVHRSVPPAA